jgi:hypothetical protein
MRQVSFRIMLLQIGCSSHTHTHTHTHTLCQDGVLCMRQEAASMTRACSRRTGEGKKCVGKKCEGKKCEGKQSEG